MATACCGWARMDSAGALMVLAFGAGVLCGAVVARALVSERLSAHWDRFWYEFWRVK